MMIDPTACELRVQMAISSLDGRGGVSFNMTATTSRENADHPALLCDGETLVMQHRDDDLAGQTTILRNVR
jgi:hypothetical protein